MSATLRELLATATRLPWKADIDDPQAPDGGCWTGKFYTPDRCNGMGYTWETWNEEGPEHMANVRLIEASVNALPGLLDRIEALEAENAELRTALRSLEAKKEAGK